MVIQLKKIAFIFVFLFHCCYSAVNMNDYEEYFVADFQKISSQWQFINNIDPNPANQNINTDQLTKNQKTNPDLIYDPNQASVSGTSLILETIFDTGIQKFKGVQMHTRNSFYFKYGVVEIQFSVDPSLSDTNDPTIIQIGLVGKHYKSQKEVWPTNGEIQIFETLIDDAGGNSKARKYKTRLSSGTKISKDICEISLCQQVIEQSLYKSSIQTTYRIVWEENQIEWMAQKPTETFQTIKVVTKSPTSIIPNYPQYIFFNVGVDKDAIPSNFAITGFMRRVTIQSLKVFKKKQS